MKKFIILLMILCFTALSVCAKPNYHYQSVSNSQQGNSYNTIRYTNPSNNTNGYNNSNRTYNPNRPEWSEFCPYQYEYAEMNTKKIVPYYSRITKWENNYWVNRRERFKKAVAECDSIADSEIQNQCYIKVRNIQYTQNNNFQMEKAQMINDRNMIDSFGYAMILKSVPQNINMNVQHNGYMRYDVHHYPF